MIKPRNVTKGDTTAPLLTKEELAAMDTEILTETFGPIDDLINGPLDSVSSPNATFRGIMRADFNMAFGQSMIVMKRGETVSPNLLLRDAMIMANTPVDWIDDG